MNVEQLKREREAQFVETRTKIEMEVSKYRVGVLIHKRGLPLIAAIYIFAVCRYVSVIQRRYCKISEFLRTSARTRTIPWYFLEFSAHSFSDSG